MDKRIQQLSYSSMLTLHSCPRKFQLYRMNATEQPKDMDEQEMQSVTFAFGHVVGHGIQCALAGKSSEQVLLEMFLMWDCNLFAEDTRRKKSFWLAVSAIKQFMSMRENGLLAGWKVAEYQGLPACELSFSITLPHGFIYRGFVDAVLVNEETGQIKVLELKTTSSNNVNQAMYKNSAQAIGYSVVLDALFPEVSDYEVLYFIYKTKSAEFEALPFKKSYHMRALWIRELLLDVDTIKLYEDADIYPMRGESCFSFYRECEYFNVCQLATEALTDAITAEEIEAIEKNNCEYQINVSISDLISSQLVKHNDTISN